MRAKKLLVYLFLVVAAIVAYQVGSFVVHYGKVQAALDSLLLKYPEMGEEEFKLELRDKCRDLGVNVLPEDIDVEVDHLAKSVRVDFLYHRQLQILFVSMDKTVRVRGYKKDLDL